jgi:pimeloyl-ACP methyl ester carboxylesterase
LASDPAAVLIYLHGAPGGPGEVGRFMALAAELAVDLICVDRATVGPGLEGDDYFRALAAEIERLAAGRPYQLAGFSLGGFVALRTEPFLAGRPQRLHLIAAAAPLDARDFLDHRAGKAVFKAAMTSPPGFARLTRVQCWLARRAPRLLQALLFAGAAGADKPLSRQPAFRAELRAVLVQALGPSAAGYRRDVLAYVRPWADVLGTIRTPVRLWHGSEDNWAPPSMAQAIRSMLPEDPGLDLLAGLSHYSTLHKALPVILTSLERR